MRKPITTTKTLTKILSLKESGLSLREIAKLTGLTGEGVRYLIGKFKKNTKVESKNN